MGYGNRTEPENTMNGAAVYARMLRAYKRGVGIHLSAEELSEIGIGGDDAIIMAALGGDNNGGPPEWLTPTEVRRWNAGEELYDNIFRPGRDVRTR